MKFYLITIAILGVFTHTSAQSFEINKDVVRLIDSAKHTFCENDTLTTIAILESIEKSYPTDGSILSTNKALAELYILQGRREEAKGKLLYALNYKRTSSLVFLEKDVCDKLLNKYLMLSAKADLCVVLSNMYLNEKLFDSALYYLNLADNEYLPYRGCGNGMLMYKSYISSYFADCYLAMGDTTNAIARLLDYFMNINGNTVLLTRKLKSILLQKYSQEEITAEVRKGLKALTFTKGEDDHLDISFPLFGHTIKDYGYGKAKVYGRSYKHDRNLKMLCEN
jgi:hypothetical protein